MKKLLKIAEKNENQVGECITGFMVEERRA
jgi:hypothetical protein